MGVIVRIKPLQTQQDTILRKRKKYPHSVSVCKRWIVLRGALERARSLACGNELSAVVRASQLLDRQQPE
jgi:hypothetical protein